MPDNDAMRLPVLPFVPTPVDGDAIGLEGVVLVVDEDREHARKVARELEETGLEVDVVTSPALALEHLDERPYDLVITDLGADDTVGLALIEAARAKEPEVEVVVLARGGSAEAAVQAMHRGALTYMQKPVHPAELRAVVRRALERVELERRAVDLERRLEARFGFESLVGNSPAMQEVFERVRQVAPTNVTTLILGETGTGKELVAKTIHQQSLRARQPFVAVNCAALPDTVVESELFGHEKGAFTGANAQRKGRFEAAQKGTLFLDEVGDIPLSTQVKLLRALEEREIVRLGSNIPVKVDVRLVAATNADLEDRVEDGRFRRDLYYRLKVVTVRLPPLRERASDLPLLIDRFLREFSVELGKDIAGITPEARAVLAAHTWPGNVRELRSVIQSMVVVATTPMLDVTDLPQDLAHIVPEPRSVDTLAGQSLEAVERELIRTTLELTGGNREHAAKILGIGERTLYRKIKKFDLTRTGRP